MLRGQGMVHVRASPLRSKQERTAAPSTLHYSIALAPSSPPSLVDSAALTALCGQHLNLHHDTLVRHVCEAGGEIVGNYSRIRNSTVVQSAVGTSTRKAVAAQNPHCRG